MEVRADHRSVVTIGASAGGVEALARLVSGLRPDLEAAVLVAVHVTPFARSALPAILNRSGPLIANQAVDGEALVPGRIYIAPPDRHLLVAPGRIHVTRGPRENGHRPSIDATFRSAANAYGPAVVGVVLSGILDDGSSGASVIKSRGGLIVVQSDAAFPDMPRNAADAAGADFDVPLEQVPALINGTIGEQLPADGFVPRTQVYVDAPYQADPVQGDPVNLTCPACGGVLNETDREPLRFRCMVGHAYSENSLLAEQTDSLEASLWAALRALEERASLLDRLAARFAARGNDDRSARYQEDAEAARRRAGTMRRALLDDSLLRGEAPVIVDEASSGGLHHDDSALDDAV